MLSNEVKDRMLTKDLMTGMDMVGMYFLGTITGI
jgi:hypothetical protein